MTLRVVLGWTDSCMLVEYGQAILVVWSSFDEVARGQGTINKLASKFPMLAMLLYRLFGPTQLEGDIWRWSRPYPRLVHVRGHTFSSKDSSRNGFCPIYQTLVPQRPCGNVCFCNHNKRIATLRRGSAPNLHHSRASVDDYCLCGFWGKLV